MSTAPLTPVSVLDDAEAKARAAACAMVPLLAATVHAQFPTGAYLVITRHETDYDGEYLTLDSVRDAQGAPVWEFPEVLSHTALLPPVPADIGALWAPYDPRESHTLLELAERIESTAPNTFLEFLPEELRTAEEIQAENDGGRTPLGIPLAPSVCALHGDECPAHGHAEPSAPVG